MQKGKTRNNKELRCQNSAILRLYSHLFTSGKHFTMQFVINGFMWEGGVEANICKHHLFGFILNYNCVICASLVLPHNDYFLRLLFCFALKASGVNIFNFCSFF